MDIGFIAVSLLNGVSLGMVLFMLTTGLSLTLGLMGVINLTHGAFFMVGGYIGWTIAIKLGANYWLAVLGGGVAAGVIGLFIERGFLRVLYKRINEQVMLTVGFIYVIANLSLWIWGGSVHAPFTDPALAQSFSFFDITYPLHRITTIGIGTIIVVGMWWLQEKTRFGAIMRAGMDNKEIVTVLGINIVRASSVAFFLGAFLAGIGGVFGAQTLGINLDMGWSVLLLALIVLVVGGMGSIQGALVGAMVIGIVDAFGRALFPDMAMFLMYLVMVVILFFKPLGLMPRHT